MGSSPRERWHLAGHIPTRSQTPQTTERLGTLEEGTQEMVVAGLCEAGAARGARPAAVVPHAKPNFSAQPFHGRGASWGAVLLARVRQAVLPARPANEKAKEPLTNRQQPKAERETSPRGHRQSLAALGEIDGWQKEARQKLEESGHLRPPSIAHSSSFALKANPSPTPPPILIFPSSPAESWRLRQPRTRNEAQGTKNHSPASASRSGFRD